MNNLAGLIGFLFVRRVSTILHLVCCLVVLAFGTASALGQTGELLGNVTDQSGAIVPGADVTVVSLETQLKRVAITDERGFYSVPHLVPASYSITVNMPGFKQFYRAPIVVGTGRKVRIDATLQVGEMGEQVQVTAATPVIEEDSGQISSAVGYEELRRVVMNGRGWSTWLRQTPGVTSGNAGTIINGTRGSENGHMFDGVWTANGPDQNGVGSLRPDQETLREVVVHSVGNPAEFSSAGTVSQSTLSGTNEFHGAVLYTHQNGALDARNFFANEDARGLPNHFGSLTLGGPVLLPGLYDGRDRTHFFFHYDLTESSSRGPSIFNTPTLAMRQGDFSAFPAITDPLTGMPFAGNIIPADRISPQAVAYMQRFFALPQGLNADAPTPASNYIGTNPSARQDDAWLLRVDQNISDNHSLYFRYYQSEFDIQNDDSGLPPEVQQGQVFRIRTTRHAIISNTYAFTPNVINELRFAGQHHRDPRHGPLKGKDITDLVGLNSFLNPLDPDAFGLPEVTISGLRGITTQNESRNTQNQFNVVEHLSWIRGNHSFKFGGDFRYNDDSQFPVSPTSQFGRYNFDGFATGQPYADFLLGIPRTASGAVPTGPFHGSNTGWSLFAQDEWRVTPNLTLSIGLRYEKNNPWKEEQDRFYSFDPASGSIVVPNAETAALFPLFPADLPVVTAAEAGFTTRALINGDDNDFAPRFGFAYRSGLSDIVVRGGIGVFYGFHANKNYRAMTGGPFVATQTFDNAIVNGEPLWNWPTAFPDDLEARPRGILDLNVTNKDLLNSYTYQWNLTLEKQIGEYGLRVSYIGSSANQLPIFRNINQPPASTIPFSQDRRPYPQFRNITYFDRGGQQNHNAFQIEVKKRFGDGFSLNSYYTWQKTLTDSNGFFGGTLEDAHDRAREYGVFEGLAPQDFKLYFIWEVPAGRGKRYLNDAHSVVRGILGGWSISGNFAANNGVFLTPFFTGRDISNTNVTSGRPDCIADPTLPGGQRTVEREYNVDAFDIPPAGIGRFGNCGRGTTQIRGFWGANMGLFKAFSLSEYLTVRVEGQIKNVFNHPKLGGPRANITSPVLNITAANAGAYTRTDIIGSNDVNPMRQLELGLKIMW